MSTIRGTDEPYSPQPNTYMANYGFSKGRVWYRVIGSDDIRMIGGGQCGITQPL